MGLTIGILSWGATKTLISTLDSYLSYGLGTIDDMVIFFQQMSDVDEHVAKSRGIRYFGSPHNLGIAEGYRRLVEASTGDFFLFLENDWLLIEEPFVPIGQAKYLLTEGTGDIVRFRHRKDPGNPLWTRQYVGREEEGLTHLLDCVHWMERPDLRFPQYIRRKVMHSMSLENPPVIMDPKEYELTHPSVKEEEWFIASSKQANWTNNPHMARTDFLKENVLPHIGRGNLEGDIQNWWQEQDFKVIQGNGLFKHWRLD
jgi:hypothetical protein